MSLHKNSAFCIYEKVASPLLSVVQRKVTYCKLQLSQWGCQLYANLRTVTHAFVCFVVRKDILTREKTAGRGNDWKQEHAFGLQRTNEDKILFVCIKLPLKDSGGIWRGMFQCQKNITALNFLAAIYYSRENDSPRWKLFFRELKKYWRSEKSAAFIIFTHYTAVYSATIFFKRYHLNWADRLRLNVNFERSTHFWNYHFHYISWVLNTSNNFEVSAEILQSYFPRWYLVYLDFPNKYNLKRNDLMNTFSACNKPDRSRSHVFLFYFFFCWPVMFL